MAKGKKKSGNTKGKRNLMLTFMLLTSIALLPTTVIFFIGMLPTIAARLGDRSREKTRVMTIGFMNFAACFPFWFQLMQKGHKFDVAVSLALDPFNISVMFGGALIGYLIEWSLSGFVAGMMVQKGRRRLEHIKKAQQDMIERWGKEVSGEVPLDMYGFPSDAKDK